MMNVPTTKAIASGSASVRPALAFQCLILSLWGLAAQSAEDTPGRLEEAVIVQAFAVSCDGFSSDELLIRDDLRGRFLAAISQQIPVELDADAERRVLLQLLKMRKSGKLYPRATRRGPPLDESITPVAEIAGRVVTDRHRISSDTLLADPRYRTELQQEAELITPGVDAYSIRKAVLSLRKRRALRPELVLRVAKWNRRVMTLTRKQLESALRRGSIPKQPGVYLFRSAAGYLYVGEAANLAGRLSDHLAGSDRHSLARYLSSEHAGEISVELHVFPSESPASETAVRRAYESELIRSRNPALNIRP